jgi:laminin alpha 3/5
VWREDESEEKEKKNRVEQFLERARGGVGLSGRMWLSAILAGLLLVVRLSRSEILTPPYFNLAEGKEIIASATCGVDTTGPELYCKLVGANADQDEDINLIQGQVSANDSIYILKNINTI